MGGLNVRFAIEAILYKILCFIYVSEAEIAWGTEFYLSVGREKGYNVCCGYDKFFFLALSFSKKESAEKIHCFISTPAHQPSSPPVSFRY